MTIAHEMRTRSSNDCRSPARWLGFLLRRNAAPRTLLDPRTLSDHLKRDMGFLDGNQPYGKHL
jgi:hypothetical protein